MTSDTNKYAKLWRVFLLLSCVTGLCYANTFNSAWHLDDYPNIIQNSGLHLQDFSIDAFQAVFSSTTPSGGTFRPAAYLTFAINWFFGKDQVVGYHLVNIVIHVFTAFFLFLIIRQILLTPKISNDLRKNAFSVALLASVFWAIHPIQTQAVTYIVQRMTSLAALFYAISMWTYISGRICTIFSKKIFWYIGCFFAWGMAFYTKQNTIILPVALVLMEFTVFQNWQLPVVRRWYWGIMAAGALTLLAVIFFLLISGDAGPYMGKYQVRPFSPSERLLTQFRVVLFYLYQIVYPNPENLSITHDYVVSTSIFTPWTTFPAILIIAGTIVVSVWAVSKGAILKIAGFSILFFFVHHLIESTVLPLEMIFEHRNYLPSFFLFLPVAVGIKTLLDYYYDYQRPLFYFLFLASCIVLISFGISTYSRNMDWQSEKTLWLDAMIKAPNSSRPPHNLALGHYEPAGMYNQAIDLYHHALKLKDESVGFESVIFYNIAAIYFSKFQDYEQTITYASKTLEINSHHDRALYLLARSLAELGHYKDAFNVLAPHLHKKKTSTNNTHLAGLILLNLSEPEAAIQHFQKCLKQEPVNWLYLRETGYALSALNRPIRAQWFFRQAEKIAPAQPEILLGMAAASLECGLAKQAEKYVEQFVASVGMNNIEVYWINAVAAPLGLPIPYRQLTPMLCNYLSAQSNIYKMMSHRLLNFFAME